MMVTRPGMAEFLTWIPLSGSWPADTQPRGRMVIAVALGWLFGR